MTAKVSKVSDNQKFNKKIKISGKRTRTGRRLEEPMHVLHSDKVRRGIDAARAAGRFLSPPEVC